MGVGWRRFTESIKQHAPVPSRFSPTSNERNEKTLEEAANVARKIKDVISDIENMNKASEIYDFVGVTDAPSSVPSPLSPSGSDVPGSPGSPLPEGVRTRRAGGVAPVGEARAFTDVDGSAASSILEDHTSKLEEEVLRPLRAWLAAYEQLRKKNEEVEALRLEVDSRRRTVSELTVKTAKKEGKLQENADTKAEAALGQARDQLTHKSDKLRAAAGTYAQGEAALHEQLVALLDDARYVQAYATKATRFQADLLAQLATIIEGPVPAGSREGDGGISLQGFEQTHHIDNGLVAAPGEQAAGYGNAGTAAGAAVGAGTAASLGAGTAASLGAGTAGPSSASPAVDPSQVPADASAVPPFVHSASAGSGIAAPASGASGDPAGLPDAATAASPTAVAGGYGASTPAYGGAPSAEAYGGPSPASAASPALAPEPAPGFPPQAEAEAVRSAAADDGAAGIWGVVPGTDGALEQTTQGIQAASLRHDPPSAAGASAGGGNVGKHYVDVEEPPAVGKHYVDVEEPAAVGKHYVDVEKPAAVGKHYVDVETAASPPSYAPAHGGAAASSPAFAAVSYDDPSGFSALGAEGVAKETSPLAASALEHAPHANPFEEPENAYAHGAGADGKPAIPGL